MLSNYFRRNYRLIAGVSLSTLFSLPLFAQDLPPLDANALAVKRKIKQSRQFRTQNADTRKRAELMVTLHAGVDPRAVAQRYGLSVRRAVVGSDSAYVMDARSVVHAEMARAAMRRDGQVRSSFVNQVFFAKDGFTPNDPLFNPAQAQNYAGQWYLKNQIGGVDINVSPVWQSGVTGKGVMVGVVDDGLEIRHPDLSPNVNRNISFDFLRRVGDPTPLTSEEAHGTAVAGLIGARGGNSIGMTGVAPEVSLGGLRTDYSGISVLEALAFLSTTPTAPLKIKNNSYGPSDNYTWLQEAWELISQVGRAGTINTQSAGNRRGGYNQDTAFRFSNNHPDVITVSALGIMGKYSSYSNFGANVMVTAPGGDRDAWMASTDLLGTRGYNRSDQGGDLPDLNYTATFGGTSASTPLVTGALALAKQVQPKLDVRFAKHLLALTSRMVDAQDNSASSDGGWRRNGANIAFNQNYGFGLVDTHALVNMAKEFTGVTPRFTVNSGVVDVFRTIPDGNAQGLSFPINFPQSPVPATVESIQVGLYILHPYRGDIEAYLTSPSGRRSRLFMAEPRETRADIDYVFTTNAFWGEKLAGKWTLTVRDTAVEDIGELEEFEVNFNMGRLVAVPQLTSLAPTTTKKAKSTTLNIAGSRFTTASVVTLNGAPLETRFLSVNALQAVLPAIAIPTAGDYLVRVVTPNPGGTSTVQTLQVTN
jgi:subtilisin family serine protease/subtilisin-like proprotein convertase family protein